MTSESVLHQRRTAAIRGSSLVKQVQSALNRTRRVRLVRNNTGFDLERKVRYGLGKGGADLVGLLRTGAAFAIECKSGDGDLTADQKAWWRAWKIWGGLGGVARDRGEAFSLLTEAERTDLKRRLSDREMYFASWSREELAELHRREMGTR